MVGNFCFRNFLGLIFVLLEFKCYEGKMVFLIVVVLVFRKYLVFRRFLVNVFFVKFKGSVGNFFFISLIKFVI